MILVSWTALHNVVGASLRKLPSPGSVWPFGFFVLRMPSMAPLLTLTILAGAVKTCCLSTFLSSSGGSLLTTLFLIQLSHSLKKASLNASASCALKKRGSSSLPLALLINKKASAKAWLSSSCSLSFFHSSLSSLP